MLMTTGFMALGTILRCGFLQVIKKYILFKNRASDPDFNGPVFILTDPELEKALIRIQFLRKIGSGSGFPQRSNPEPFFS